MNFYREKLDEDLDIGHICDTELDNILMQVVRSLLYNNILFGKDITYYMFIENLKIYLGMTDRV